MIGCSQTNIKESDIYKYLESHIGHLHTLKVIIICQKIKV